ncbi:hypothetical protein HDU96_009163 [Phlyctochytrium bullatum]|nr:hypothetical protein HDU96_009163 [Phlyctochytrium bullatum]
METEDTWNEAVAGVPFVCQYVRTAVADERKREEITRALSHDRPYVEAEDMAVVMIDISGYSSLTTKLSAWGKVSSEVITTYIGGYLRKIVDIVNHYQGDVIKFLGDAVLVTFSSRTPTTPIESPILRATLCCLHIMVRYPVCEVERPTNVLPEAWRSLADTESGLATHGFAEADMGRYRLTLHVALTAGPMCHILLGALNDRLDYVVDGVALRGLGDIIDEAKSGELGFSHLTWNILSRHHPNLASVTSIKQSSNAIVVPGSSLLAVFEAVVGGAVTTADLCDEEDVAADNSGAAAWIRRFRTPDAEFAERAWPEGAQKGTEETLGVEGLKLVSRFVNKSIIYKLRRKEGVTKEGVREVISSEFRKLHIIFVKLKAEFTPEFAQKALTLFLKSLQKHGGPFTHENDARRALLASAEFMHSIHLQKLGSLYVSVATGDLMFGSIGGATRAEASFLGDAVNVAARIIGLGLSNDHVVCDLNTRNEARGVELEGLGAHKVKGKIEPLELFAADLGSFMGERREAGAAGAAAREFVGYPAEREGLVGMFEAWRGEGKQALAMVEGASGMGKSRILEWFAGQVRTSGTAISLTQGSEIDLWTPYYGLRGLMQYIYSIQLPHSFHSQKAANVLFSSGISQSLCSLSHSRTPSLAELSKQVAARASEARAVSSTAARHVGSAAGHGRVSENATSKDWKKHMADEVLAFEAAEFLQTFGEDGRLAPLLGAVIPGLKLRDNEMTEKMDGKARKALLSGLIVRIVAAFTETHKAVFVFDDAQWLDPISLEILLNVVRPIEELKFDFLRQVKQIEGINYSLLKGFTHADVETLIVNKFEEQSVTKVSEKLKNAIFERAGGSPLASDMIMESLKLKSPEALKVTDGLLDFSSEDIGMDSVLASTAGAAIVIQFDRVHPSLQDFLKKACILGQYFNLTDVATLMELEDSLDELRDRIVTYDKFRFLVLQLSPDEYDKAKDAKIEDFESVASACYFRHITIMNTIYDLLPFGERQAMHLRAARYYEELLEKVDRSDLLPTVAFHYYHAGSAEKIVMYLEELGLAHLKKFLFSECITTMETLIGYSLTIDVTRPDISDELKQKLANPHTQALWHSILGMSLAQRREFNPSFDNCLKSLEMLKVAWPKNDREVKKATGVAAGEQAKLFKATGGGSVPCKLDPVLDAPRRLMALSLAMNALFSCSAYNPVMFSNDMKALILFWNLNVAIKGAADDPATWTFFCNCAVFGLSWKLPKLALPYIGVVLDMEKKHGSKVYGGFHFYGIALTESLKFAEAYTVFGHVASFSRATGDVANEFCGLYYQSLVDWVAGRITSIQDNLSARIGAASQSDIIWPACGACSMVRAAVILDNYDQMDLYQERLTIIVEKFKIPYFLPPLLMCKAWRLYKNHGDPEEIVRLFEEMAKGISIWNEYAIAIAEGVLSGIPLLFLLIDQCLTALEAKKHRKASTVAAEPEPGHPMLTVEHARRLECACKTVAKVTNNLRKKLFMGFVGLMGGFYDVAARLLRRGGRKGGVRALQKLITSRDYAERFRTDFAFLRAISVACIGAYNPKPAEGSKFMKEGLELMNGFGAVLFVSWLKEKGAES